MNARYGRPPRLARIGVAAIALCLVTGLGGCVQGDQPEPGDPTGRVLDDPTTDAQSPDPGIPDSTPTNVPDADQKYTLDDTAEFDDGLMVGISGTIATKASLTQSGADSTDGQIVIASVTIENQGPEVFEADLVTITATYGDGKVAPMITDSAGELQNAFGGEIEVGDEASVVLGFAIPFSEITKVTIVVDCADDVHVPVTFEGTVVRG